MFVVYVKVIVLLGLAAATWAVQGRGVDTTPPTVWNGDGSVKGGGGGGGGSGRARRVGGKGDKYFHEATVCMCFFEYQMGV
jgi:hypothetical protein